MPAAIRPRESSPPMATWRVRSPSAAASTTARIWPVVWLIARRISSPNGRDHDERHHDEHQHALPALGAFLLGLASGDVGELVHPGGELVESDVELLMGGVDSCDLPRRRGGPVGDRVGDSAGGGQVVLHRGSEVGELMAQLLAGADAI